MNFASKAAFLKVEEEDDEEEVYAEDLEQDIPAYPQAQSSYLSAARPDLLNFSQEPMNVDCFAQAAQEPAEVNEVPQCFGDLPPIIESADDMYSSNAHLIPGLKPPQPIRPAQEEQKLPSFSSLQPGSGFTASIAGKDVSLIREAQKPASTESSFSSLSAGAGFMSSLQGKSVSVIREGKPGVLPPQRIPASSRGDVIGTAPNRPLVPGFQPNPPSSLQFYQLQESQGQPVLLPPIRSSAQPSFSMPPQSSRSQIPAKATLPKFGPSIVSQAANPMPMAKFGPGAGPPQKFGPPGGFIPAVQGQQPFIPPRRRNQGQVFRQQVDANVVDIPLNVLKEEMPIATGDPQFCRKCTSLLNSKSVTTKLREGNYQWICEFCGQENEVHIDEEEVPKANKLTYILESAIEVAQARQGSNDKSVIIFVVDTSGSMCVTQPAPGKFALKMSHLDEEFKAILMAEDGDQFFPGQDRNTTYISRLECVQAAIEAQINDISTSAPDRRVGLITFSEDVKIIGDGMQEVTVAGDKLNSYQECLKEVQGKFGLFLGRNIGETKEVLLGKVMAMQEKGATALGPATLMAVALAKEGGPGSKVILCTDGIANVGLGSLESAGEAGLSFYERVSELAKDASISVSVLSIEGEECKLNALLPLAVNTGGDVNKVNPLNLKDNFANVVAAKTVATGVEITVNLHKALKFRNADAQSLQQHGSRLERKLGTVCENESFIFEYCTKAKRELLEEGVDVTGLKQVPFQVLVKYQRPDGMKCVFVDTEVQMVTDDRDAAMQQAEYDLLSRNARHVTSNLAMQGRYQEAQVNSLAWGQAMIRNQQAPMQTSAVMDYYHSSAPLYNQMNQEMRSRPPEAPVMRQAQQSDSIALEAHKQQKNSRR